MPEKKKTSITTAASVLSNGPVNPSGESPEGAENYNFHDVPTVFLSSDDGAGESGDSLTAATAAAAAAAAAATDIICTESVKPLAARSSINSRCCPSGGSGELLGILI